jgi:release factor glutamine methyltransferase
MCHSERSEESLRPEHRPVPVTGTTAVLRSAERQLRLASIEDAALEAEILLAHTLGLTRTQLLAHLREPLDSASLCRFDALLARRLQHEPFAYITGRREFYGLDLLCSPAALIPRPETELLVELALDWLGGAAAETPLVVDVGTGTGALALAIATTAPHARVIAIDISRAALELATRNAARVGVADRVSFVQGSLLSPLRTPADVIVANLPYISDGVYATLAPEVRDHEPQGALRAGPRGTEPIEALLAQACPEPVEGLPTLLAPGGLLLAEHAWDQAEALRRAARAAFPHAHVETKRDLAGLERVLMVEHA